MLEFADRQVARFISLIAWFRRLSMVILTCLACHSVQASITVGANGNQSVTSTDSNQYLLDGGSTLTNTGIMNYSGGPALFNLSNPSNANTITINNGNASNNTATIGVSGQTANSIDFSGQSGNLPGLIINNYGILNGPLNMSNGTPNNFNSYGGTLQANYNFTGNWPIVLGNGGITFTNTGNNDFRLNGIISGNGTVTKAGGIPYSTLLGGNNTFIGPVNITSGYLGLSNESATSGSLGAMSNVITLNGGGIYVYSASNSARNYIMGSNGGNFIVQGGLVSTFSGVLSGAGGLTFANNTGTLVLTNNNTYQGSTTINSGIIQVGSDNNLGNSNSSNGAVGNLILNGGALQTSATMTSMRSVVMTGTGTINNNGFNPGFSGVISGSGALNLTGNGTTILSGANTNTGGYILGSGTTLSLGSGGRLPGSLSVVSGATATTLNINGSYATSGTITNVASINVNSPSTWTLNNAVSGYGVNALSVNSGATLLINSGGSLDTNNGLNLSGGTLSFGSSSTYNWPLVVTNGGVISSNGFNPTISSVISGSSGNSLNFQSSGSTTLSASNTFTAPVTVSGGSNVLITSDSALGASGNNLTLNNGTVTAAASFNWTTSRNITLGSGGGVINGANDVTLNGIISGTGSLSHTAGSAQQSLILKGANTFVGPIYVTQGFVGINNETPGNNSGSLGANGNIVNLNNGGIYGVNALSSAHNIVLGTNGGTLAPATSTILTLTGVISGTGGLTHAVLTGSSYLTGSNTYNGNTTITTGTLRVNQDSNLGNNNSANGVVGNIILNGGILQFGANGFSSARAINLSAASSIDNNSYNPIFSGVISGSGALTLLGSGSTTFAGNNSNTGGQILNSNTNLILASGGKLSGNLSVASGATGTNLTINASTSTSGTVTGVNTITLNSPATWSLNNAVTGYNANGLIVNAGATLRVNSGGSLDTANNISLGGTLVAAGGSINPPYITPLGSSTLEIAANTTLSGTWPALANFIVDAGVTATINGTTNFTNLWTINGSMALNVTNNVPNGTFPAVNLNAGGQVYLADSMEFALFGATTNGTITPTGTNKTGILHLRGSNSPTFNINGGTITAKIQSDAVNYSVTQTLNINQNFGTGNVIDGFSNTNIASGATFQINHALTNMTNTNVLTGGIVQFNSGGSLGGPLTAAGQVTLNGGNLGSNGLSLNGGSLLFNSVTPTYNWPIAVTSSGGSINNNSLSPTLSGVISGAGLLTFTGSGTTTLSGTNTLSGGFNITGGTVYVSSDSNLGASSSPVTLNGGTLNATTNVTTSTSRNFVIGSSGATLSADGSGDWFLNGVVSGSGPLTKSGTGYGVRLTNANNTFTGAITVTNGFLGIQADGSLGNAANGSASYPITLGNGGLFALASLTCPRNIIIKPSTGMMSQGGATATYSGILSGTGDITQQFYNGTLVFSGANTYTGNTTLVVGILQIAADNNLGNANSGLGNVGSVVFNGGTLQTSTSLSSVRNISMQGAGTLDNAGNNPIFQGIISGSGALNIIGAGTTTLTGANTTTGGFVLGSGSTLKVSGGGILPGNISVASGATSTGLNVSGSYATSGTVTGVNAITVNSPANWQVNNTVSGYNTTNGIIVNSGATMTINPGGVASAKGIVIAGGTLAYNNGNVDTVDTLTSGNATLNFLSSWAGGNTWPYFSQINLLNGSTLGYTSGAVLNGPITGTAGSGLNITSSYNFTYPLSTITTITIAASQTMGVSAASNIQNTTMGASSLLNVNGAASLGAISGSSSSESVTVNASGALTASSMDKVTNFNGYKGSSTTFTGTSGSVLPSNFNYQSASVSGDGTTTFLGLKNGMTLYVNHLDTFNGNAGNSFSTVNIAGSGTYNGQSYNGQIHLSGNNNVMHLHGDNITAPLIGEGPSNTQTINFWNSFTPQAAISNFTSLNIQGSSNLNFNSYFSGVQSIVLNNNSVLTLNGSTNANMSVSQAANMTGGSMVVSGSGGQTGTVTGLATITVNSPANWQVNGTVSGYNTTNGIVVNSGATMTINSGAVVTAKGIVIAGGTLAYNNGNVNTVDTLTSGNATLNFLCSWAGGNTWPYFSQINLLNGSTLGYTSGAVLNGPITGTAGSGLNINSSYNFSYPLSTINTITIAASQTMGISSASNIQNTTLGASSILNVNGPANLGTITGSSSSEKININMGGGLTASSIDKVTNMYNLKTSSLILTGTSGSILPHQIIYGSASGSSDGTTTFIGLKNGAILHLSLLDTYSGNAGPSGGGSTAILSTVTIAGSGTYGGQAYSGQIHLSGSGSQINIHNDVVTAPIYGDGPGTTQTLRVFNPFTPQASISAITNIEIFPYQSLNFNNYFSGVKAIAIDANASMNMISSSNAAMTITGAANTTLNISGSGASTGAVSSVPTINVNSPANWQVNGTVTGYNTTNGVVVNSGATVTVNSGGSLGTKGLAISGGTLAYNGGNIDIGDTVTSGNATFNFLTSWTGNLTCPNFSQINLLNGSSLTYASGITLNGPITGTAGSNLNVNTNYTFSGLISTLNTIAIAANQTMGVSAASNIQNTTMGASSVLNVNGAASLGIITGSSSSENINVNASGALTANSIDKIAFINPTKGSSTTLLGNSGVNLPSNFRFQSASVSGDGTTTFLGLQNGMTLYVNNFDTYNGNGGTYFSTVNIAGSGTYNGQTYNGQIHLSGNGNVIHLHGDNITAPLVGEGPTNAQTINFWNSFTPQANISNFNSLNVLNSTNLNFNNYFSGTQAIYLFTNSILTLNGSTNAPMSVSQSGTSTNGSMVVNGSGGQTGSVTGLSTITVNSPATWQASGAVTGYSSFGLTVMAGGTLQLNSSGSLDTGGLYLNGGTLKINSAPITVNWPLKIGGSNPTITGGGGQDIALSNTSMLSGTATTFTVMGNNELYLNNPSNNFTATIVLNGSVLTPASDATMGNPSNVLQMGNGGGLFALPDGFSTSRGITLTGGGARIRSNGTSTLSSVIAGTGPLSLEGGTNILTGLSSYTGGTIINSGTVVIAMDSATSNSNLGAGNNPVGSNGLTLNGAILKMSAALTSSRYISVSNPSTIDNGNNAVILSGVISNSGSLSLQGTGTTTLSGSNTNTGGINLGSGTTLSVANDNNMGASGSLSFYGSSLITTAGIASTRALNLLGAGTINSNSFSSSFAGAISGSGLLTLTGSGSISLLATNTNTGGVTCGPNTTVSVASDASLGSSGSLSLTSTNLVSTGPLNSTRAWQLTGTNSLNTGTNSANLNGNISGAGTLTLTSAGITTINGVNSFGGLTVNSAASLNYNLNSSSGTSTLGSINNAGTANINNTAGSGTPSLVINSLSNSGAFNVNTPLTASSLSLSAGSLTIVTGNALTTTGITHTGGTLQALGSGQVLLNGTNASYSYNASSPNGLQSPLVGNVAASNQGLSVNSNLNLVKPLQNIDVITVAANKTFNIANVISTSKSPTQTVVNSGSIVNLNPGGVRNGSMRGNSGTYNINTDETTTGDIVNVDSININGPATWTVVHRVTGYVGGLRVAEGATLNLNEGGIINDSYNPIIVSGTLNVNGGLINWAAVTRAEADATDTPDTIAMAQESLESSQPCLEIAEGGTLNWLAAPASMGPIKVAGQLNLANSDFNFSHLLPSPEAHLTVNHSLGINSPLDAKVIEVSRNQTLTLGPYPSKLKTLSNHGILLAKAGADLSLKELINAGQVQGFVHMLEPQAHIDLEPGTFIDSTARFKGMPDTKQTLNLMTHLSSPSYLSASALISDFDHINIKPGAELILNQHAEVRNFKELLVEPKARLINNLGAQLQGRRLVSKGILHNSGSLEVDEIILEGQTQLSGSSVRGHSLINRGQLSASVSKLELDSFDNQGMIEGGFTLTKAGQRVSLNSGSHCGPKHTLSFQGQQASHQVLNFNSSMYFSHSPIPHRVVAGVDEINIAGDGTRLVLERNNHLVNFEQLRLGPATQLKLHRGASIEGDRLDLMGSLILAGGDLGQTRLRIHDGGGLKVLQASSQNVRYLEVANRRDSFELKQPLTRLLLAEVQAQAHLNLSAHLNARQFNNEGRISIHGRPIFQGEFNQLPGAVLAFGIRGEHDYDQLQLAGELNFSPGSCIAISLSQEVNKISESASFDLILPSIEMEGAASLIQGIPEVLVEGPAYGFQFTPSLVNDEQSLLLVASRQVPSIEPPMPIKTMPRALMGLAHDNGHVQQLFAQLEQARGPAYSQLMNAFDLRDGLVSHYNAALVAQALSMQKVFHRMDTYRSLNHQGDALTHRLRAMHFLRQESWLPRGFESRSDVLDKIFNKSTVNIAPIVAIKRSHQDAQETFAPFVTQTQGLGVLVDKVFARKYRVGLGLTRSASRIRVLDDYQTQGRIKSWQGMVFANLNQRHLVLDGVLSFNQNRNTMQRSLTIGYLIARSRFASSQWTAQARIGYEARRGHLSITPVVSAQYARYHQSPYTQTGADIFNQSVGRLHVSSIQMGIGTHVSYELNQPHQLIGNLHLMVYRDDKARPITTTADFVTGTGEYNTQSPLSRRSSFNLGGGLSFLSPGGSLWSIDYDIELRTGFRSHSGLLKVKAAF